MEICTDRKIYSNGQVYPGGAFTFYDYSKKNILSNEIDLKNFIKEETKKEVRNNLDSALIFNYIQQLEKENKDLKNLLKEKFGYLIEE